MWENKKHERNKQVWFGKKNSFTKHHPSNDKGNTKIAHTDLNGEVKLLTGNVGGVSIGRPYGGGSYSVSNTGDIAFTHTTPYHPSELGILKKDTKNLEKSKVINEKIYQVKKSFYDMSLLRDSTINLNRILQNMNTLQNITHNIIEVDYDKQVQHLEVKAKKGNVERLIS